LLYVSKGVAYLRVELVDLARQEPVGLLGVGVVDKVFLDLLGLSGHLDGVSIYLRVDGVSEGVGGVW
jgi:hypothetical protein